MRMVSLSPPLIAIFDSTSLIDDILKAPKKTFKN